jgi:uncharacterized protein (AIM24 family)
MRDTLPRPPFDQGLFLTHLNRGKADYEQGRLEEAERELEEAYLLRPRDQNVLNLLGLVYFKQDKLEKAEEVYRKLASQSPDVPILFHNLGLIDFKLGRLDEAESAFLKALQLFGENPKINFYLGSIYERRQRFQDAIYQYRQAGANLMVRRVETKLAATPAGGTPRAQPKPDDTAEFKTRDLREALGMDSEQQPFVPPARLQPVSESLMSERAPSPWDAAPYRPTEPPSLAPLPSVSVAAPSGADRATSTRPVETFRFLETHLMEINLSGKVFIKQGTIYSYGGNLTFWVKERRPGGHPSVVMITGNGKVLLTDKDREITFMHVETGPLFVEPSHLLACEETLTPRYARLTGEQSLEFFALEGKGMVALSVVSKPLTLDVRADLPVSVPATAIICWTGALVPRVVQDRHLYEVMMASPDRPGPLLRLEGQGRLLVEQGLA